MCMAKRLRRNARRHPLQRLTAVSGQVKLRTADGVDFNPVTVTGLTSPFSIPSLNPDGKAIATFVFEIPRDVHARSLSYLPDPSKTEAIVFTV